MTTYETLNLLSSLPMPIVVSVGIYAMAQANNKRAEAGKKTEDALTEAIAGLRDANRALREILEKK